jgi:DNA-binding MarR family transcriptional regulator
MQGKLSRTQNKSPKAKTPKRPPPSLALSISHAITRIFREQNRLHGRAVKELGLSTEQAHLLVVLWTLGPMTMTALGREVALSSGTLTAAIDRMEAAGLVRRVADATDRRAVRLEPAPWSAAEQAEVIGALLRTEAQIFAPLTAAEREQLLALLMRVQAGLTPSLDRRRPR